MEQSDFPRILAAEPREAEPGTLTLKTLSSQLNDLLQASYFFIILLI